LIGRKLIKAAIVKVALYTVVGPFKAWLIKLLVNELLEHIVEPAIREMGYEIEYQLDVQTGKKKVKQFNENRNNANAVRNSFSQL